MEPKLCSIPIALNQENYVLQRKHLPLTPGSLRLKGFGVKTRRTEASRGLCLFMDAPKSQMACGNCGFTRLFQFTPRKRFHHGFSDESTHRALLSCPEGCAGPLHGLVVTVTFLPAEQRKRRGAPHVPHTPASGCCSLQTLTWSNPRQDERGVLKNIHC